jgi:hypothetical protein
MARPMEDYDDGIFSSDGLSENESLHNLDKIESARRAGQRTVKSPSVGVSWLLNMEGICKTAAGRNLTLGWRPGVAVFSRSKLGFIRLYERGGVADASSRWLADDRWELELPPLLNPQEYHTAASAVTMSAGRHYATFQFDQANFSKEIFFGVIRPDYDVEFGKGAAEEDGHCFYDTGTGQCSPGGGDWEGRQPATKQGDRIGLLLDLNAGTLAVYKNEAWLGVMSTGLVGEYSWAVSMKVSGSARIEPAPAPTRTAVEVEAANALQEIQEAMRAASEEIFAWAAGDEGAVTRAGNTRLGCVMGMGQDAAMSEETWVEMAAEWGIDPEAGFTLGEFRTHFTDSLENGELMELLEKVRRVKAAEMRLPPMCSGPTRIRMRHALREAKINQQSMLGDSP